ncbi:MAG TPA: Vms1/Ankzf1 family peptidyl-tRNA hydrolase [Gaiellaceae bacterium]|nr:Vms1/Ankzf1 family peptidyl-tRNA hydrolase [Gaiellaceae bacterium]
MATAVTTDTLRGLAGVRAANGCAISIYLDLDPSATPTIPDVQTKFNAVLSEAEKAAEAHSGRGRECRLAVRDDIARIRDWWSDEFDHHGSRGVAVFAASAEGFFHAVPLPDGTGDSVHVGPSLHLAPLARALDRDGSLVAVVGRERGTIYRLEGGRLQEVADEYEEQPGQHDQGGWSQGRYQRHIENLVQQHLKSIGGALDEHARAGGLRMVVVGPLELRGEFESELSNEARAAIVGWASAEAHAGPSELLDVVRPLLDEARARADRHALVRFEELHGRGERSATGWKQVLDAASDARVDVLLVEEGAQARAWECPQCGRASADGGDCPLDGTKLEERDDAVDLALHQVLANGGSIVRVGAGALGDAKGIGALLRY